jgi:hypothetical protein
MYSTNDDGLNNMVLFVTSVYERTSNLAQLVPTICELKKHDLISDWHMTVQDDMITVTLDFKIPSIRLFYNYIPLDRSL